MPNRFEQPIASEFINTYIPIPFKEMMVAGQMKQQRYDAGAAAQDAAIQRTEMIQAIAGSPDDRERTRAIQKMYDIRDKYIDKDLSDSFVLRQMNNDINTGIDKPWLQKMQESRASWDEAQKAKRTLAMNNKWNPILDEDPGTTWNSKADGTYNYQPRAFTDKTELFNPYYKDLKSESMGIVDSQGYAVQREGISKTKVLDVTNRGAQELLATQQGRDLIKIYRVQHPTETPDKISDVKILQDQMYDYGKQWISSNDTVLGATLQPGGGAAKKTPLYSTGTNTKGGIVENYKNEREAQNKINELKASTNPTDARKASDMEQVIVEAQQRRDQDFSNQTNPILQEGVDKLISSGAFNNQAEAHAYLQQFLNNDSRSLDEKKGGRIYVKQLPREIPEWAANQLLGVIRGNKELFDMAGSGMAALADKGVDILAGNDHGTLGDLYTGYKKSADANDTHNLYGKNRKNNKQEAIVWETMKKLAGAIKSNETNYSDDIKNSLSRTSQDTYMVNIPSLAQESLAWNLNSAGTKQGNSEMGSMAEDITIRPEDHIITEVDGRPITDTKLSNKIAKTFNEKGFQVERISPVLNLSSKNGYLPSVDFIYKSEKTTDEGTPTYRRRLTTTLKPEQYPALINNLIKVGAYQAAHILSRPDLAQEVDSADYTGKGKQYTMITPGSKTPETIDVKGSGSKFTVSYQGTKPDGTNGPVEEVAKNRSELRNILLGMELNNMDESTGIIPKFQF